MKIRNGFVSNSSSSSFVILATKDKVKEVLNGFTTKERKFIKNVLPPSEKIKFNGKQYVEYLEMYETDSLIDEYESIFAQEENGDEEVDEEKEWVDPEPASLELFEKFVNEFNRFEGCYGHMKDF